MNMLSRRALLGQTGTLALAAPLAGIQAEASRKPTVIVTGGHPGDPEYGCGGTIARYTDMGHEVVLLYLSRGEWPPRDPGVSRVAEAAKACEILKARPLYAGQFNNQAVVDQVHYDTFGAILEAERPDAVFTHWPIDNHADHRAISMLVYDAWLKMGKCITGTGHAHAWHRERASARRGLRASCSESRVRDADGGIPRVAFLQCASEHWKVSKV